MSQCPCGSTIDYFDCCGLYISDEDIPKTPETLMRSRYTAYSMANIDYIKKTMKGKPLINFNDLEASHWAKQVHWMGLKIIETHMDSSDEQTGFVEFIATYLDGQTIKNIHEISQFQYTNNHWFYVDGQYVSNSPRIQQISRNAPCPCGSKKKFKNCHAPN